MWYFNAQEIVKFAVGIEHNGQAFYREMAGRAGDDRVKKIFAFMAGEEEKHEALFGQMLSRLPATPDQDESYPGEYQEYMRELVDSHVFTSGTDVSALGGKVQGEIGALDMALSFEKDSILFFHEMKRMVPAAERHTVDQLIEEEHRHIKTLLVMKRELTGSPPCKC
ncbi:MAG TPA: ferritin family protein [Spirochaetia bacterium]|nr:ferritin family protein [Spirochaetia bacterium]